MILTFEDMQAQWKKMEFKPVSREDLLKMTYASHLPRLQKMKRRLILEIIFSLAIMSVVMIVLDLFSHGPLWLTVAFLVSIALYLFNLFLGYSYLSILPQAGSLRASLTQFLKRMKTLEIISAIGSISMSVVSILIIQIRDGNLILWALVLLMLLIMTWLPVKKWSGYVKEVAESLKGFDR